MKKISVILVFLFIFASAGLALQWSTEKNIDGEEIIPANGGTQVYWASGDTRTCGTLELDPAVWAFPRSIDHKNREWQPGVKARNSFFRTDQAKFNLTCEFDKYQDVMFDKKLHPDTKTFSPSAAIAHTIKECSDIQCKLASKGPFKTATGLKGVKVVYSFTYKLGGDIGDVPTYHAVYIFPYNAVLPKKATPIVVTFEGETSVSRNENFDPIVNTLKLQRGIFVVNAEGEGK